MNHRRTSPLKLILLLLVSRAGTSASSDDFSCIDLTPFANDDAKLATLLGGGVVDNDEPVFFEIKGGFQVYEEMVFCLENITIPDQVGDNICNPVGPSWNCQLAVGYHSQASKKEQEYCEDMFGNPKSCYECLCAGADMSGGTSSEALHSACGMADLDRWANSCHDVTNGRVSDYEYPDDGSDMVRIYSDYAVVHVPICAESFNYCGFCDAGGVMPSFKIGIQWISNVQEQCFDHPFGQGLDDGLSYAAVVGISVGVAVLVVLGLVVVWLFCKKKNQEHVVSQVQPDEEKQ